MQCVYPAIISLHPPQTGQMAQQSRHAARHARNAFQEDEACQRLLDCRYAKFVTTEKIEVESNDLNGVVSQRVQRILSDAMDGMDAYYLLGLP